MAADFRAARPQAAARQLVRAPDGVLRGAVAGNAVTSPLVASIYGLAPALISACGGWAVPGRHRAGACPKGDAVQTTLLGLAIAFIIALVAALIGPYFIDWNQFRPQFEAEATQGDRRAGALRRQTGCAAAAGAVAAFALGGGRRRQRSRQGARRQARRRVQSGLADARRIARHRTDHQWHGARSRPGFARAGSTGRPRPGNSIWDRWRSTG